MEAHLEALTRSMTTAPRQASRYYHAPACLLEISLQSDSPDVHWEFDACKCAPDKHILTHKSCIACGRP